MTSAESIEYFDFQERMGASGHFQPSTREALWEDVLIQLQRWVGLRPTTLGRASHTANHIRAWEALRPDLEAVLALTDAATDDDFTAPTRAAKDAAKAFFFLAPRDEYEAPTRIVPTGDGGVSFELELPETHLRMSFDEAGRQSLVVVDLRTRKVERFQV